MKHHLILAGITVVSVVLLLFDALLRSHFLCFPTHLRLCGAVENYQSPINAYRIPDIRSTASTNASLASQIKLAPYSIEDLVKLSSIFDKTFGILVYDPMSNEIRILYNYKRHKWRKSCAKLVWSFQRLTDLLRMDFPERFRGPESSEIGKLSDFDALMKCDVTTFNDSVNITTTTKSSPLEAVITHIY
jgi:hypothetical protein